MAESGYPFLMAGTGGISPAVMPVLPVQVGGVPHERVHCADLVRDHDWPSTPLGPRKQ